MKIVDEHTWYESEMVPAEEFTIEFVEAEIAKAKKLGATIFRTTTDKGVDPWLCGVVLFAYKEEE